MLKLIRKVLRIRENRSAGIKDASKIFTHLTDEEKQKLHQIARLSGGTIVEVGSYLGASSCFLATGIREFGSGKLVCVDTWLNDAMSEGARDTYNEFQKNTADYGSIIQAERGVSIEVAKRFQGEINVLFLDADHEYNGIKSDWDSWSPYLAKNAFVILHDIGWADGVKRVLNEDVKPATFSHGFLPNMFWGQFRGDAR